MADQATDWIDWAGGECPIPGLASDQFEIKWQGKRLDEDGQPWMSRWATLASHELAGWDEYITAYCVVPA